MVNVCMRVPTLKTAARVERALPASACVER